MKKRISIKDLTLIIEQILKVRGGRGLGTGHPVFFKNPSGGLGNSKYEPETMKIDYKNEPVQVSRAFNQRREDEKAELSK